MGFNANQTAGVLDKNSPAFAVQKFNTARSNLLIALILTVVNILLGAVGANVYMLFSISFPYYFFDVTDIVWSIPAILALGLWCVYYFGCKKKPGFMIAAMISFILDFLLLIGISLIFSASGFATLGDFFLDYLAHIWVLVYLIIGTKYTGRYRAAIQAEPSLTDGGAFRNAALPADRPAWSENAYSNPAYGYPEAAPQEFPGEGAASGAAAPSDTASEDRFGGSF